MDKITRGQQDKITKYQKDIEQKDKRTKGTSREIGENKKRTTWGWVENE